MGNGANGTPNNYRESQSQQNVSTEQPPSAAPSISSNSRRRRRKKKWVDDCLALQIVQENIWCVMRYRSRLVSCTKTTATLGISHTLTRNFPLFYFIYVSGLRCRLGGNGKLPKMALSEIFIDFGAVVHDDWGTCLSCANVPMGAPLLLRDPVGLFVFLSRCL